MADALARALMAQEYHPVLVFGPQSSGKTTLLLSLFDYLTRGSHEAITLSPGPNVLPNDYPSAELKRQLAEHLFTNGLLDYQNDIAPLRTSEEVPFLIPVDLVHRDGVPNELYSKDGKGFPYSVRLAFIEGMGEWYELETSGVRSTKRFKEDIGEILRAYEQGISVIYVAPTISADTEFGNPMNQKQSVELDSAMSGTIKNYVTSRPEAMKEFDHELFLLSKWDTKFGDRIINGKFTGSMKSDVYSHIFEPNQGIYRAAWNRFSGRPRHDSGTLSVMPHFAGRIPYRDRPGDPTVSADPLPTTSISVEPRRRFVNTRELRDARDHFNRALANWLYGNATASLYNWRRDLFPDMVVSENKVLRWYESTLYFLVGGSKSSAS